MSLDKVFTPQVGGKYNIEFQIQSNRDFLPYVTNEAFRYSNTFESSGGVFTYYAKSMSVLNARDLKKFVPPSKYNPKTNHVALISLASEVDADNRRTFKNRKRTFAVFDIHAMRIRKGGHWWDFPGVTIDMRDFKVQKQVLDTRRGSVIIEATYVGLRSDFTEDNRSLTKAFMDSAAPILDELGDYIRVMTNDLLNQRNPEDVKEATVVIQNLILNSWYRLGIDRPYCDEIRKNIAHTLLNTDALYVQRDGYYVNHPQHGEVYWDNREVYELDVELNHGGDIDKACFEQKKNNHYTLLAKLHNREDRLMVATEFDLEHCWSVFLEYYLEDGEDDNELSDERIDEIKRQLNIDWKKQQFALPPVPALPEDIKLKD